MIFIANDFLAEMYKKETGNEADYEESDRNAIGRVNHCYYDDYVEWLEEKLLLEYQSKKNNSRKINIRTIHDRLKAI